MNPKIRLIAIPTVLGLVLLAGYAVDRVRASEQSVLSGFFETQDTQVASRLPGRVAQILVKEGDVVKKGQPLLVLEAGPQIADLEAKRAQAHQANKAFEEAKNGTRPEEIARQRAVVAEAAASLQKLRNGPLPEEIAEARRKLDEAKANYRKVINGPRPQELAQAVAQEKQAFAALKQSQRGATQEERRESLAHLHAAQASEAQAKRDAERYKNLADEGAVSAQKAEVAETTYKTAIADRQQAQEAYDHIMLGTPAEELAQAEEAYRRAKAAADMSRAGSRTEDIQASLAQVRTAEAALALVVRGSRTEDIAAAEARLNQASATLSELEKGNRSEMIAQAGAAASASKHQLSVQAQTVAERTVVAPIDGVVQRVLVHEGDLLNSGTATLTVIDPNDIWVRVYVPENNLAKISAKDAAKLKLDGIDNELDGYVESINTSGEFTPANLQTPEERAKQVFGVRIRLTKPDPRVHPGMYVTVKSVGQWK